MADAAIRVVVRARPLMNEPASSVDVLNFIDTKSLEVQNKIFSFDKVFLPNETNDRIYASVADKITTLFEGYNLAILAYGPTGSGKSYTMGTTSDTDSGIIMRAIRDVFTMLKVQDKITFTIKATFLEVYKNDIFDLLESRAKCGIKVGEDKIRILGLTEVNVTCMKDAIDALVGGMKIRTTCSTGKNISSSRSHAIFSLHLDITDRETLITSRSKLEFVDLAGSERIDTAKTKGHQITEGIDINLGLLTLGKVILALKDRKRHIPYRDSVLTTVLRDSLGGNSHTIMIVCISPSATSIEETVNSLRYASSARGIKNCPTFNKEPPSMTIARLRKELQKYRDLFLSGPHQGIVKGRNSCTSSITCPFGPEPTMEFQINSNTSETFLQDLEKINDKKEASEQKYLEVEHHYDKMMVQVKEFHDELVNLVAAMTAEATTNSNLQPFLEKLEAISSSCLQIMVHEDLMSSMMLLPENMGSNEILSSDGSPDLMEGLELSEPSIKEISEQQKLSQQQLEDVRRTLTVKKNMIKNMQFYFNTHESVNEENIKQLITKISLLMKDKEELLEEMTEKEQKCLEENRVKFENYEREIKNLQNELCRTKFVLQKKEENKVKISNLETEMQNLKKLKVKLIKQIKEESNKFLRLQREKEKEVAKLVREVRKKDFVYSKEKNKLEKQLTVLKQRIDQANTKKAMDMLKRKAQQKHKICMPKSDANRTEEWIIDEVKVLASNGITRTHIDFAEEQAKKLREAIETMTQIPMIIDNEEKPILAERDDEKLKEELQILCRKIEEMKADAVEETEGASHQNIWNSLNTMAEVKTVGNILLKRCINFEVDKVKHENKFSEIMSLQEQSACKINNLNAEITKIKKEMNQLKVNHENQIADLQWKQEEEMMNYINEIDKLIPEVGSDVKDPKILEKLIKMHQEFTEQQTLLSRYKSKVEENEKLQQQLFRAKKGKRVKWLSDLTTELRDNSSSLEEVNEDDCMLDEYLTDSNEESFTNDQNDPDWRATPLWKQRRRALRSKEPFKNLSPNSVPTGSSPLKPSASGAGDSSPKPCGMCQCNGSCKTARCKCKKDKAFCDNKCGCTPARCKNRKIIKRKISFEHQTESPVAKITRLQAKLN